MALGRGLVEKGGAGAAPRPLLGAPAHGLDGMGRVRSLDPAVADTRHVHAVPVDQVEHGVRSAAYERGEVGPTVRKHGLDLIGIVFDPRDDLAAVAPGTAPAGLVGLQHDRLDAAFGKVKRSRQSGITRADDAHVGGHRAFERRRRRRGRGGRGPQGWRQRKRFGH